MDQQTKDYRRVAEAIRYLGGKRAAQPSLAEVAVHVGVSPAHFQRLFTRWVGVSPKRYVQYLTLGHARRLLADRMTLLDAAYESGLSSPGRLHDLFVTWEAMTPGEYASGGRGLEIAYGWFSSPFGTALALGTDRGLCGLAFAEEKERGEVFSDMARRWPHAYFDERPDQLEEPVRRAFEQGETRLLLSGTPFQIKVWEALLRIPSGYVSTYETIARAAGNPNAVRAAGTAIGRNPLAWLIPCHRALRKSGELGGYHWGLGTKRAMLAREAARADAGASIQLSPSTEGGTGGAVPVGNQSRSPSPSTSAMP